MAIPSSRIWRPSLPSASCDTALSLFASSAQCTRRAPLARFSTSPTLLKGPGRGDNNKNRGVSGVRHTGMRGRQTLSVREKNFANQKLPTPVQPTSQITGDPDHGLYDFFREKKLLLTPVEESRHGMSIAFTIGSSGLGLTMNQDEHGLSTSFATATGRRCNSCGGCVSRKGIDLRQPSTNTKGRVLVTARSR